MATYITDAELEDALAAHLKLQSVDDLPDSAVALLPVCNLNGYNEVRGRLLNRGFTLAQIDAWDRATEFNRDIALFWLLVHAANLTADDLWVNKLDRRAELDTVAVTSGGDVVLPGATGGAFATGRLLETDQAFTRASKF